MRGALELKFKGKVTRISMITFLPMFGETIMNFIVIYFGLDFPILVSFTYAIGISSIGAAVVIPIMIHLVKEGYGFKKGIPLKIIAASTFENIVALVVFGILAILSVNSIATEQQNIGVVFAWIIL